MLLTQLSYFVAVAREGHFGRAAASCFVSPSALSEAIRKLEVELGVPLIRRGRTYEGLTPEGERAIVWARRMLAEDSALRSAVHSARGALSGEARLGVIPSATTWATGIVERAVAAHPDLRIALRLGLSSDDIMTAIRHYELDAGLVHPSVGDEHDMQLTSLGSERFVLVTSVRAARPAGSTITVREVVDRPLCLFDPLLRARMLLDDACAGVGVVLRPVVETNSVEGLIAVARSGVADAVVPASTVAEGWPDLRVAAINDPEIRLPIALARLADEPRPPVVAAIEALVGGR